MASLNGSWLKSPYMHSSPTLQCASCRLTLYGTLPTRQTGTSWAEYGTLGPPCTVQNDVLGRVGAGYGPWRCDVQGCGYGLALAPALGCPCSCSTPELMPQGLLPLPGVRLRYNPSSARKETLSAW